MLVLLDFRLKKRVEDISDKAKYYLIKKNNEANSLLKRKFAEAVAPGQGDAFIATILETNQNSDVEKTLCYKN